MRTSFFSIFLVLTACTHPVLASDSSSCYAIPSADARAYCLAKARKDASTCYNIQDSAKRAQCLSEARG
jgi:hypothetical protein